MLKIFHRNIALILLGLLSLSAIQQNVKAQGLSVDNEALSCPGLLQVSVSGGTSPYTYLWEVKDGDGNWIIYEDDDGYRYTGIDDLGSNKVNERRIVGADPGVYRLTAEDQNGLTGIVQLTLTPPVALSARIDFEGLICLEEEASGLVLLEFINGFADYTWVLSQGTSEIRNGVVSGSTYLEIEGLSVGVYTLDWTDANLCTGTKTVTIAAPGQTLDLNLNIIQDVSCPGGNDGSVSLNFSGGWTEIFQVDTDLSKYMFELYRDGGLVQQWSNTEAANNIVNLEAGNYMILYSDRVNENNTRRPFSQYNFDSDSYGCTKSQSFTITEPDPFELNLTATVAVCHEDTNGEIAITPSGGTPTYIINFYQGHFDDQDNPVVDNNDMTLLMGSPTTNVSAGQTVNVENLPAGNYSVLLKDDNNCFKAENLTIIKNPLGQVVPINDITACSGDFNQLFTTSETTGTTRYEWINDNTAIGLAASGTGNISFTATNTSNAPIAATITVTPFYSNHGVECEGPVETFEITVNPEPVGVSSQITVCSDDSYTINLQDNIDDTGNGGNGLASSFSWEVTRITGVVTGVSLNDTNTGNIVGSITNSSGTQAIIEYTVTPTANTTGCAGDEFTVTVTVDPEPVGVSTTEEVCSDVPFTFDPQENINDTGSGGNGVSSTFSWEVTSITGTVTGVSLNDTNTGDVVGTITNTSSTVATVVYTVTPTSDPSGCEGASFTITVSINPEPVVVDQTVGPVCSDESLGVNFNGSSTVAAATYNVTGLQLNSLTVSAGGAAVANGLIDTDLSDDAFTNTTNAPVDVVYTVIPVSSEGAEGQPFTITVTINPEPVVDPQTKSVCSDEAVALSLGNDADGPNVASYNLISITDNGLTAGGGNQGLGNGLVANAISNDTWTNLTSDPVDVVYTLVPIGDNGCAGDEFTVTVTVDPEPVGVSTTEEVCSDVPFTFDPQENINDTGSGGNGVSSTFSWEVTSITGTVTGVSLNDTNTGDVVGTITNTSSTVATVVYTVTPTSDPSGCEGASFTITVSINPEPVVVDQTVDPPVCSDESLVVNFNGSSTVAAATYNVTGLQLNGLTVSAGGAAVANGLIDTDLSDDAFTNTTNAPVDVVYTVVPVTAGGCEGDAFTVTVTINPEPVVVDQTVGPVCSDEAVALSLGNDADGPNVASYNLISITDNGLTAGGGNQGLGNGLVANAISNDTWTNLTSDPVDVVYTLVPIGDNGCAGDEFTVTVTVDPEPVVVDQTVGPPVCSDESLGVNFNGSSTVSAATYNVTALQLNGLSVSAGGAAIGNGLTATNLADDAFTNTTNAPVNVEYTVVPVSAAGCEGDAFKVTVTVEPKPVISDQVIAAVCTEQSLGVNFNGSSSVAATTYNVINLELNGLTVSAGDAGIANGLTAADLADDAFTNTTNAPQDVIYTVVPVTAAGCEGQAFTVTVTVKDPIIISGAPHDYNGFGISCHGADDGFIEPTITGGKLPTDDPNYVYSWSGPNGYTATSKDIYNLAPGTYSLTVGDGENICQQASTFEITEPDPITVQGDLSEYNSFEISCNGESDGSITLAVQGGTGPGTYLYTWSASNGGAIPIGQENAANLTGIPAGDYEVSVTDLNNCTPIVVQYTLTQPDPITLLEETNTRVNVLCYGEATGSIRVVAAGGSPGYVYTLNGQSFDGENVSRQSELKTSNIHTFENLLAGEYVLSVVDLNACQTTLPSIAITQPNAPLQTQNILLSDYNGFNVNCFGDANGSISLEVTGGVAPYQYAWEGPNGFTSTSQNIQGIEAGNYELTVTDSNGCVYVENIEVTSPEEITLDVTPQNVLCGGAGDGNIFINSITGGTGSYVFVWIKDGEGEIKRTFAPEDLTNIGPGSYVLIVTDENNCNKVYSYEITEPEPLIINVDNQLDIQCFGEDDGLIEVDIKGGTAPYVYNWSGPDGFSSSNEDIYDLFAGTYVLEVTDALQCTQQISITLSQPTEILINPVVTNVTCFEGTDGAIDLTLEGGVAPYQLTWSGPDGFTSTNEDLANLKAGVYNLSVLDNTNCTRLFEFEVKEPDELIIDATVSDYNGFNIGCKNGNNGFIDITMSGGNGDYKYFWEGPLGFRANTEDVNLLTAGLYNLTVVDKEGCSVSESFALTEPNELLLTEDDLDIVDVSCFGGNNGMITVNIRQASAAPYTYVLQGVDINGVPYQRTETRDDLIYSFDDLRAGIYELSVSDANNCSLTELTGLEIQQPDAALSADIIKSDVRCFGANDGAIQILPTGGTAPYNIQWNMGSRAFDLNNLSPGTYTATLFDANGCEFPLDIEVLEAPVYAFNEVVNDISCNGQQDGSIELNIIGGVQPLEIQWVHGPQEPNLYNLEAGIYEVTVTDAIGCVITASYAINEPAALSMNATVTNALDCEEVSSGNIAISPVGGTPPYTYEWSNGTNNQNLVGVGPGTYSLKITDERACTIIRSFEIQRPQEITVRTEITSTRVCEPRRLETLFTTAVSGGVAPYTIEWSRGNAEEDGLIMKTEELGVFSLTITDSRGCEKTFTYEVIDSDPLIPDFSYDAEPIETGDRFIINNPITFTDLSEGKFIEQRWEFGDGSFSLEQNPTHTYTAAADFEVVLYLTDETGCIVEKRRTIKIEEGYRVMMPNAFTPNGDGRNDFYAPSFLGFREVSFLVYNNWGELIYASDDLQLKGWNGEAKNEAAENGNYIYKFIGITHLGIKVELEDNFLLIR